MGHLLLTLCLLAATTEKPAAPQKASPTHKKRAPRAKPPAQQPSSPAPTAKTKTAMA